MNQLEGLEIQVEARMIRESELVLASESDHQTADWKREFKQWSGLLGERHRRRVLIGVVVMAFQRNLHVNKSKIC